jgi:hypothetical protein
MHMPTNEPFGATLTVVRVEFDRELGPIIYTSLSGVRHPTWETHMFVPFAENALDRSVIALLREDAQLSKGDLETFQEFHSQYQQGVESGKLEKCFKITVAEVIKAKHEQELEEKKIAERKKKWPWWRFWE